MSGRRLAALWEWLASDPKGLRIAFLAGGLLLFFAITLIFAFRPIRSFDPWWHLASGRWIFLHHQIPYTDPFSHTCHHCKWIDLCWLFQVLAYLSYKAGGLVGYWILKAGLVVLTMVVFSLVMLRRSRNIYMAVLLSLLGLVIVQMRFMARPHMLGFLCLLLFVEEAISWTETGRPFSLVVAGALYLLWLNSHGSFLVAFAVAGALFLGDATGHLGLSMKELVRERWLRRHLALLALLVVASLVTPYGAEMVVFALTSHLGKGADATRNIAEWHPMRFKEIFSLIPGTANSVRGILFLLSTACVLFSFKRMRRESVVLGVLLILSLALSLRHSRFVAISALLLLPWVVVMLSRMEKRIQLVVGFILVFYLAPLAWKAFELPRIREDYGKPVASFYPWDITSFINKHGIKGNLLNEYGMGGFLIWSLYPNCRVYIDGRTPTVYSPFQFWLYRQTDRFKPVMNSEIKRTGINVAIVRRGSNPSHWLWDNSTWCLATMDDERALYLDNSTAMASGARCLHVLKPFVSVGSLLRKKQTNSTEVVKELNLVKTLSPHSIYPYRGLEEVFREKDEKSLAVKELKEGLRLHPKSITLHFDLGKLLATMKGNHTEAALDEMKKVLRMNSKLAPALYYAGVLSYNATSYKDAKRYLLSYLDRVGDGDRRVYTMLGLTQYKLFEVEEALDSFTKAVVLTEKRELKKVYYNYIGNCYWGLRRYKEAINSYRLALRIDPEYQDARENLRRVMMVVSGRAPQKWNPKEVKGLPEGLNPLKEKEH